MPVSREEIVAEAKTWLGTPYHHMGMLKGVGVDCATLLVCVYSRAGMIEPFSPDYYPPDWMKHRGEERYLADIIRQGGVEVLPPMLPRPGDVVAWKLGRCFSHGGIVIDWPVIIHAHMGAGAVVWGNALEEGFTEREQKTFTFWDD